ncbi:MAG: NAD(+) synthase [Solobacterium sp.]|nr:NAD(+) synthase [Solobacterium sp.]
MKNMMIKAGTAVPKMRVADPRFNTQEIISLIRKHHDCGILVFPELCLSGYTCADLFGQQALYQGVLEGLKEIEKVSAEYPETLIAVGAPIRHANALFNTAVFFSEGVMKGIIPKINIPNYSEFYEQRWFSSGKRIRNAWTMVNGREVPFGTDLFFEDPESGVCVGCDICEDLWVPDKPSTHACLAGANVIVNLSASDELIGKQDFRRTMVLQQSAACYCSYLYTSAGSDESSTDLVFSGHTLIAQDGRLLSESIFDERSSVKTAVLDIESSIFNRAHQNTFTNQKEKEYQKIPVRIRPLGGSYTIKADDLTRFLREENYEIAPFPFVPKDDEIRAKRCQRILHIQAQGLATRVRATGIKTLVIGISGGLDSTLALIVCHEARKIVPDIRIIGYTMPNEGNTTSRTYDNAIRLMQALEVEIREVPIGKSVKLHLNDIGHGEEYLGESDTTYENAQARMRTYILMDAANMENGLVVGTGDLSELALGWCTYNGDHMSMYGVNASVPKTLVQYICRVYAEMTDNKVLSETLISIVDTPISPELTPNMNGQIAQKTEEKIGKYDLNDFFLFYCMRYGFDPEKILAFASVAYPALSKESIKEAEIRFFKRFFYQQFKRSCLPDGPKVGSVTLSPRGDWRMPSDAAVSCWLEALEKA